MFLLSIDNPELLAPLLDYADDLEVRDGLGWTPLMTAVNRGSRQNTKMLLARGAKVDCDWAGGMSLIADAMNFADSGKTKHFQLISKVISVIYLCRTCDDAYGSWSSGYTNS